jgi:L-iditol 2-dehydrogenase
MRAALKKNAEVRLGDVTLPATAAEEIRIRVTACGVCGTDLHVHPGRAEKEMGFGHEVAGTVVETGAAVTRVKVGDRVVLDSSTACGLCDACKNARQELCTSLRSFWPRGSFGFAEEMLAPAACAIPCPDLSPEVACLQEPLGVAIDMVRLAEIEPGVNTVIAGAGPIGLMAIPLLRRAGARRVFVTGRSWRTARAETALRLGADEFIPADGGIAGHDFGGPIHRVLVTAPPRVLEDAVRIAAKGAIISFIGIEYGEGSRVGFDANEFHFKKLQLRGSFASPALYGPMALDCLRERVVDGEALISHRFPLAEIARAMETARKDPGAVKVVVVP